MFSLPVRNNFIVYRHSIRLKRRKALKAKLKPEKPGILLVSLFHLTVGAALTIVLVAFSFRFFHVGALAVLNLILAYGLLKMKRWSVKLLALLFPLQIVFGSTTLFYEIMNSEFFQTWEIASFNLSIIIYVVLCFVSLAYVVAKRKIFK
jgi:hypothetical protein